MKFRQILVCLLFFLAACGVGRTPSKDRFETISKVKLPSDHKILKDEYQGMLQDYTILFDIQLTNKSADELTKSIKQSAYFNPAVTHQGLLFDSLYVHIDTTKSVWCKSKEGYMFHSEQGRTEYWVWFDTLTKKVSYKEFAD